MRFKEEAIEGVFSVESDPHADERGGFMRAFCAREFGEQGLPGVFVQASVSTNPLRGTIRGLHFQWPPSREGKLVRCLTGAIYDVVVDLRPSSATFLEHYATELSERNCRALYIPEGCAHGFQVQEAGARVLYQMTDVYEPSLAAGFRYDDPAFRVRWPETPTAISERDLQAPSFDPARYRAELERRAAVASPI